MTPSLLILIIKCIFLCNVQKSTRWCTWKGAELELTSTVRPFSRIWRSPDTVFEGTVILLHRPFCEIIALLAAQGTVDSNTVLGTDKVPVYRGEGNLTGRTCVKITLYYSVIVLEQHSPGIKAELRRGLLPPASPRNIFSRVLSMGEWHWLLFGSLYYGQTWKDCTDVQLRILHILREGKCVSDLTLSFLA